jgi:hypothetical protein
MIFEERNKNKSTITEQKEVKKIWTNLLQHTSSLEHHKQSHRERDCVEQKLLCTIHHVNTGPDMTIHVDI